MLIKILLATFVSLLLTAKAEEQPSPILIPISSTTITGYVDVSAHWNPGAPPIRFEELCRTLRERGFELHVAPPELCTDNAVMGAIAFEQLRAGRTESLELDVIPGLVRH